ncbi:MAG TPA: (5-formylfuran-3-yl)methyl phosphate synthase [Burkholderiales bacterium]
MTRMLASVRTLDEGLQALHGGADLIDLKEPSRGALGALDHAAVRICVRAISGRAPVSATIGDLPAMDPPRIAAATDAMAATGVDFIKIGFFARPRALECAQALASRGAGTKLIAVLFAEESYDPGLVDALARSGFAGAMLDTAQKAGGSLRTLRSDDELHAFVDHCHACGLLAGLAGSLAQDDVVPLLNLVPDYLGFRGALCRNGERGRRLDAAAFAVIRAAIPRNASAARTQAAVAA